MAGNKRVVVAMSGGVDSSVAAALLQKQGFEVIGISMCFDLAEPRGKKPACCGISGIDDARRVARILGIPHYVVNMQRQLKAHVIMDFCREYMLGHTPNPCVRCNQFVKFDGLLKKALQLGAAFLATGHYARIGKRGRSYLLKKGRDTQKDQSYFLYLLGQRQLSRLLFPLGALTKQDVRTLARSFGLHVADKRGSQDICFLAPYDHDYRPFLKDACGSVSQPGDIVDREGKVLGRHQGISFYTVGQRKGLAVAKGYPLYITRIDAPGNRIQVGSFQEACSRRFRVKDAHFIAGRPKKEIEAVVKIRYNHSGESARISPGRGRTMVTFGKAQFAVTPGQSAVFYQRQTVIGGGVIDEVA